MTDRLQRLDDALRYLAHMGLQKAALDQTTARIAWQDLVVMATKRAPRRRRRQMDLFPKGRAIRGADITQSDRR